jgi:hypothetical protein
MKHARTTRLLEQASHSSWPHTLHKFVEITAEAADNNSTGSYHAVSDCGSDDYNDN